MGIMIYAIRWKKYDKTEQHYHVSLSIKLFLFFMTLVSVSNYFFRMPLILILRNYDFALNYYNFWVMFVADYLYCIVIIVYFIFQLFYVWFYLPKIGFFEGNEVVKTIVQISFVIYFTQKWLFETLIAREENCEELLKEHNQTCFGQRHYTSSLANLTTGEYKAFYINQLFGPVGYSFTMELLVAYFVLMCLCKPVTTKHISTENESPNIPEPEPETTSELVNPLLGHEHIPHDHGNDTVDISHRGSSSSIADSGNPKISKSNYKKCFISILMAGVMILSIGCLFLKLVVMFDDEENRVDEDYKYIYRLFKGFAVFVGMVLFVVLNSFYKNVQPKKENDQTNVDGCLKITNKRLKFCCCYANSIPFSLFHETNEPDLQILKTTFWISAILLSTTCFLQSFGLAFGEVTDFNRIWYSIAPNFLSIFGYALNYDLLQRFLLTDSSTFKALANDKFTIYGVVPFQVLRSFIRGFTRFVQVLDPEIAFVSNDFLDQAIAFVDSLYPFSILIHITTALCWAEVIERFFEEKAYKFPLKLNDKKQPKDGEEEQLIQNSD